MSWYNVGNHGWPSTTKAFEGSAPIAGMPMMLKDAIRTLCWFQRLIDDILNLYLPRCFVSGLQKQSHRGLGNESSGLASTQPRLQSAFEIPTSGSQGPEDCHSQDPQEPR